MNIRIVKRILICVLLFCACSVGSGYVLADDEGLSDEQLYGNGSENVLGNHIKSTDGSGTKQSQKQSSQKKQTEPSDSTEGSGDKSETSEEAQTTEASSDTEQSEETKGDNSSTTEQEAQHKAHIEITGIAHQAVTNQAVELTVEVADAEQQEISSNVSYEASNGQVKDIVLNVHKIGAIYRGSMVLKEEGNYAVHVTTALLGVVQQQKELTFSIDLTAPAIPEEEIIKACSQKIDVAKILSLLKTEDVKEQRICINEQQVHEGVISEAGEYDIEIYVKDDAGNENETVIPVSLKKAENTRAGSWFLPAVAAVLLIGSALLIRVRMHTEQENKKE